MKRRVVLTMLKMKCIKLADVNKDLIIVLLCLIVLCFYNCSGNKNKAYLVEETNYIHCSKDVGTCKYIDQAKENGYNLKTVDFSSAPYYEYKICRFCFSPKVVQEYDNKIKEILESKYRRQREIDRKDSLINSVSDEVREAIIEDYLESHESEENGYYPDDDRPHGRYQ